MFINDGHGQSSDNTAVEAALNGDVNPKVIFMNYNNLSFNLSWVYANIVQVVVTSFGVFRSVKIIYFCACENKI